MEGRREKGVALFFFGARELDGEVATAVQTWLCMCILVGGCISMMNGVMIGDLDGCLKFCRNRQT